MQFAKYASFNGDQNPFLGTVHKYHSLLQEFMTGTSI